MKNIIVICGIETIRRTDGTVLKTSTTFRNNARTIEYDYRNDNVVVIDARDYLKEDNPMAALWAAASTAFGIEGQFPIDRVYYSGHSDPEGLYVYSHIRKELPQESRYFMMGDKYWRAYYAEGCKIYLFGCQTAGTHNKKFVTCIAQDIANRSGCAVYGYAARTSQQKRKDGRYYQRPDYKTLHKFTPIDSLVGKE